MVVPFPYCLIMDHPNMFNIIQKLFVKNYAVNISYYKLVWMLNGDARKKRVAEGERIPRGRCGGLRCDQCLNIYPAWNLKTKTDSLFWARISTVFLHMNNRLGVWKYNNWQWYHRLTIQSNTVRNGTNAELMLELSQALELVKNETFGSLA